MDKTLITAKSYKWQKKIMVWKTHIYIYFYIYTYIHIYIYTYIYIYIYSGEGFLKYHTKFKSYMGIDSFIMLKFFEKYFSFA